MSTPTNDSDLTPSERLAFEIQNAVEIAAWQNRKIFARRRRQPWIAALAYASAIDAYLLGLEHGARGRVNPVEIARHLKDVKAQLVEEHHATKRATQKAPVKS